GSFEHDLAETSEAFLAASVLVSLKAEVLEAATFAASTTADDEGGSFDFDADGQGWLVNPGLTLPSRPERHLWRRPVAPPPLQRPVTLGELIRQLEDIAERIENDELRSRNRHRPKRYSERAAIAQVAALAHREKLPETTAALSRFLLDWPDTHDWTDFDQLCHTWAAEVERKRHGEDFDSDRPGVFWALLFLAHQGKVELQQQGGLFGPLSLRRLLEAGESRQLPLSAVDGGSAGSAQTPSHATLAA
ncbi:MAG: segregation and condensation protein A, partial [Cyanobacteria bacterium K_DeepCast_35m_m2_023]|nr:segregation and condensation protein A [Cyanobacteria bacterium K_DeepCast_35m_m2_023]